MFFEQHIQSSIKHRRLRYLVLFALRTLLFAAAGAGVRATLRAPANPARQAAPAKSPCWPSTIRSACAPATGSTRPSRWPRSAIGGLRPGERAQVLAFGSRVAGHERSHRRPRRRSTPRIDAIEPSDARTSFAELARSLALHRAIAAPAAARARSIPTCSRSGMPANFNDLRLNADVRLEPHALVGKAQRPISRWRTWWRRAASTTAGRSACWPPSPASARRRPSARFRCC